MQFKLFSYMQLMFLIVHSSIRGERYTESKSSVKWNKNNAYTHDKKDKHIELENCLAPKFCSSWQGSYILVCTCQWRPKQIKNKKNCNNCFCLYTLLSTYKLNRKCWLNILKKLQKQTNLNIFTVSLVRAMSRYLPYIYSDLSFTIGEICIILFKGRY